MRVWKDKCVSVIGAFSPKDGLAIKILEDKEVPDSADLYPFVMKMAQTYKKLLTGDMYFIMDNSSIHQFPELTAMLKRQDKKFHLVPLPTYSPRLNPIEQVWNALKAPVKHTTLTTGESVRHALIASREAINQSGTFSNYFLSMQRQIYPLTLARQPMH